MPCVNLLLSMQRTNFNKINLELKAQWYPCVLGHFLRVEDNNNLINMTNNKQQTAVEWFLDQLIEHRIIIVDKTTYQVKYKHEILLEQAKEMEKKQIILAITANLPIEDGVLTAVQKAELYYEQTYGGGEQ